MIDVIGGEKKTHMLTKVDWTNKIHYINFNNDPLIKQNHD